MPTRAPSPLAKLSLRAINFYRNHLRDNNLHCCRFYPTCSAYAQEVIRCQGVLAGIGKTALRLLRCHPFSRGGYDPVT